MNVLTRLKYLVGMLLVVGAVAALALSMNHRISTVHDVSATVRTEVLAGRNSFWCPRCQPVFRSRARGVNL